MRALSPVFRDVKGSHITPSFITSPPLQFSLFLGFPDDMPRRSSGGRSAPRAAPRRSPAPAPVNRAPPPAPVQNSSGGPVLGGIGSTIAQGMAFGTGSAVAHRAVDAVMGPRTIQHETIPAEASPANSSSGSDACSLQTKAFLDCLDSYGSDISKCQFYMDMLSECRRNSALNA